MNLFEWLILILVLCWFLWSVAVYEGRKAKFKDTGILRLLKFPWFSFAFVFVMWGYILIRHGG